jgi:hypothetical protein
MVKEQQMAAMTEAFPQQKPPAAARMEAFDLYPARI